MSHPEFTDLVFVDQAISRAKLKKLAERWFGDLVKAVVDIERGVMVVGGELHVDEEMLLLEQGSKQENLWGINLYLEASSDGFVEFDSMVNIRPRQGNRSRGVEDATQREKILAVVQKLVVE